MKKRSWIIFFCMVLLGAICLTGCGAGTKRSDMSLVETQEPQKTPEVFQGGNITLSMDYGFDKYVKSGRYMRVSADITNNGGNFVGNLQVIIPNENQRRYMYQKEVSLAAGETKRVEMSVPVGATTGRYNFVLVDERENPIAKKSVKAYISRENTLFTGVLTDDTQGMSYLTGTQMKTFYLDAESFPEDAMALDSLDVIVINDFNTEKLNEKQYEALKGFVNKGGSLVLGTGATGQKTLARFEDSFINGTAGSLTRKTTAFGLNEEGLNKIKTQLLEEALQQQAEKEAEKERAALPEGAERAEAVEETKEAEAPDYTMLPEATDINRLQLSSVEKDILDLHLEGAQTVVKEDGVVLLEKLAVGRGNVLLYTVDLGLDFTFRDTLGKIVVNQITENISADKAAQIRAEENGYHYSNYTRNSLVELLDEENRPHVTTYAGILLVYLLVTGPLLYLILKKLDRRNLMWLLIPVFSVLFGTFIYGVGDTTRQDSPYVGYLTMSSIENGNINENTFFSITAPYNDDYEMDVSQLGTVLPVMGENYYGRGTENPEDTDYNVAIKYGGDTTKMEIRDYPAFSPVYFETSRQKPTSGMVDSTLRLENFKAKGEVTNLLGYDLKKAALYVYGALYILGDMEQGETISVDEMDSYNIMSRNDLYRYDELLYQLSGGRSYGSDRGQSVEDVRRYYAYEYFFQKAASSRGEGCYLLGFSGEDETVLETMGLKVNGINMTEASVAVNLTDENGISIPTIDRYIKNTEGNYDPADGMLYEESVKMEVQFENTARIKELVYSEAMNDENKNINTGFGFYGEVKAYNYLTGNYDVLFVGGQEGRVPVDSYINEDNKMQLLLELDKARMNNYSVTMPVLSAIKEGK